MVGDRTTDDPTALAEPTRVAGEGPDVRHRGSGGFNAIDTEWFEAEAPGLAQRTAAAATKPSEGLRQRYEVLPSSAWRCWLGWGGEMA